MLRALTFRQCGPDLIPRIGVICGLSLLGIYSALRGFSPATPVFACPQKPTHDLVRVDLISVMSQLVPQCTDRWFSRDVTAAMLVLRTIEKKSFGNLTLL